MHAGQLTLGLNIMFTRTRKHLCCVLNYFLPCTRYRKTSLARKACKYKKSRKFLLTSIDMYSNTLRIWVFLVAVEAVEVLIS